MARAFGGSNLIENFVLFISMYKDLGIFFFYISSHVEGKMKTSTSPWPWWHVQVWCSQPAADFYSKLFIVLCMVTWTWNRLLLRMVLPQCREEASASRQCCVNSPILHCINHKVGLSIGILIFPFWLTCRNNRQLLTVTLFLPTWVGRLWTQLWTWWLK